MTQHANSDTPSSVGFRAFSPLAHVEELNLSHRLSKKGFHGLCLPQLVKTFLLPVAASLAIGAHGDSTTSAQRGYITPAAELQPAFAQNQSRPVAATVSISSTKTHPISRAASNMPEIQPFTIDIPDSSLEDLNSRLARTRLPDQLNADSWLYGTDLIYLRELLAYWRNDFDWRAQERELNSFDQFITQVDDLNIHFIHQRSKNADAIPLLLVHGWPGSVSEFRSIIDPLTSPENYGQDPMDAFHVIAPSLPGFGFSEIPTESGYSPEKMAHIFAELMAILGYERYAIAGGDWGAIINRHLANTFPDRLIGLHSNMILAAPPADQSKKSALTPLEVELRADRREVMKNEFAYQQIQGTKPQSLGYALNDSPAGLAAWIIEKFHGWSDLSPSARRNLSERISMDDLLTNISIYWHTQTITSSMRIYYENRDTPTMKAMDTISVPTGAAVFPADIYVTPRAWAEESYNILHWTNMPRGGHFAAMEEPDLYLQDLRTFFGLLRSP